MTLCGRSKKGGEKEKEGRRGREGGRRGEENGKVGGREEGERQEGREIEEEGGDDIIHVHIRMCAGLFDTHLRGCIVPWRDEFWQMYHWGS